MNESLLRSTLFAQLAATLYMVGVIWMVQLVHYPLYNKVGREAFPEYETRHNDGMTLTVAFDYGSRAELARAAALARRDGAGLSEGAVASHLYDPSMPDVDLLIRTSGESRISNFLLWQIAGTQVFFTERSWPDLDAAEFDAALALVGAGA